jgi:CRISPR-associated exonuclease Cas4
MTDEFDYLAISGIQHFSFCKRQWALIYLEKIWLENYHTSVGRTVHKKVDDPFFTEVRKDIIKTRSVELVSHSLKVYGVADVIEFQSTDSNGVRLKGRSGFWKPIPVEYKKGREKASIVDEVQLCLQGICLEEMLGVNISYGYLYYAKTRSRVKVELTKYLRNEVASMIKEMTHLKEKKVTPLAEYKKTCTSCSLYDICLPKISRGADVEKYIRKFNVLEGFE